MKRIAFISLIIGFILSGQSCDRFSDNPEPKTMDLTKKSLELIESDNAFGLEFFKEVLTGETSPNIMVSPLSVALALGMTYNGASGTTKEAMKETFEARRSKRPGNQ